LDSLRAALADRYRLDRELGQGGMATVYLAHDLKHDRDVALKVLRPELAAVLGRDRFLTEIRVTAKLDHPHILTLIDSGESDGSLWYVLPYVRGESLRDRLTRDKQLGVEEALAITKQIAGALDYAHHQGVIHRDIKPENILLHEGEAMLADFGIALAVREAGGHRLTETGLSLGTPQYMSPEQATGDRQLDARSDVYSLGAVLYEMLAGEPPHSGPTVQAIIAKLMTERPTRLRVIRDTVPEGIDAAVAKALAKVRADRFGSVAEFADALVRSQTTSAAARRSPRSTVVVAVLLGVALLVAVVLIAVRTPGERAGRVFVVRDRSQLTSTGEASAPAISADGKEFAYVVKHCDTTCSYGIEIQDLRGSARRRVVDGATVVAFLTWSPDRRLLAFFGTMGSTTGSYIVSTVGGEPRYLGPVWAEFYSGGDSLLLTPFESVDSVGWVKVAADNGESRDSIRIDRPGDGLGRTLSVGHWFCEVVFTRGHREWRIVDRLGRQRDVFRYPSILWLSFYRATHDALWIWLDPGGSRQQVLIRIPFDDTRGKFAGVPDTILVAPEPYFDVTADGRTIVFADGTYEYDLWALESSSALTGRISEGRRLMHSTSSVGGVVSPDGRSVLVKHTEMGPGGGRDALAVEPFAGGVPVSYPTDGPLLGYGWMPDGVSFHYAVRAGSGVRLVTVNARTGAHVAAFPIADSSIFAYTPLFGGGWAWVSPSGQELRVQVAGEAAPHDLPVSNRGATLGVVSSSPDGSSLAVVWSPSLASDSAFIDVMSVQGGRPARWAAFSDAWPTSVSWLDDGSFLTGVERGRHVETLYRVRGPGRMDKVATLPRPMDWITISRNGRRGVGGTSAFRGDIWVAHVALAGTK